MRARVCWRSWKKEILSLIRLKRSDLPEHKDLNGGIKADDDSAKPFYFIVRQLIRLE